LRWADSTAQEVKRKDEKTVDERYDEGRDEDRKEGRIHFVNIYRWKDRMRHTG
jgi:hypothetical protein